MNVPVRPGYKPTEVGIVPADWAVEPLANVADKITVGIASSATHAYRRAGIPLLRNQNIKAGYLDDADVLYVDPEYERIFKNKRLEGGDLLIARTGYPGTTCVVPSKYASAQSFTTLIVRPKKSKIDSNYLCYYLNSEYGQNFFEQSQIGGAQKNVNAGSLKVMPIPVQLLTEQRAIAAALSDMDALISGLDQLIAKKRDIKQAAMQQLLTGQKRLPGFSKEWEVKPMRALGRTYGGLAGKTKRNFGHGDARYIPFMNVMTDTVIDPSWLDTVDIAPDEVQNLAKIGDLFFNGSSETPEEVGFCSVLLKDIPNLYLNSFCFGFRFNCRAKVNGLFFAYWFRSKSGRTATSVLAQGATRYNIAKGAFMQLEIPQPSEEEQTAIATILADMDGELATLKIRCDKARQIKLGMMQELLTGRIRLI